MALGVSLFMILVSVVTYGTRVGYESSADIEDPSFEPEEWMMDWLEEMEQSSPDPDEVVLQGMFVSIFHNLWFWVFAEILLIPIELYWVHRESSSQKGNSDSDEEETEEGFWEEKPGP